MVYVWSVVVFPQSKNQRGLTEWLIETQMVTNVWPEAREIEHDRPFAPVCPIRGVGGHLSEQVEVRLAELDVDAKSRGPGLVFKSTSRAFRSFLPASVCRRHHNQFLIPLGVEQLPHPLQHLVGEGNWESQLQGISTEIVIPLCLLIRVQTANENVVYDVSVIHSHSRECRGATPPGFYVQLNPVTGHVVISSLVSLVWKLGFSQIPKKISSASILDVARALPVLRMEMAAAASTAVTEKVD